MANPTDPISDNPSERISPNRFVEGEGAERSGANKGFDSYMQQGAASTPKTSQGTAVNSPMQLNQSAVGTQNSEVSMNSLIAQAKTAQDTLGTVEQQLNTPSLKLKRSQSHLLRNKLTDANERLNNAAQDLGLPSIQPNTKGAQGPFGRFVAYVNAGQEQFAAVQSKLSELAASGQQLNPADMMLLQSKMNIAQQEIEYSSALLSKVIDSIKTMMNTQL